MPPREMPYWVALYNLEGVERERAQQDADDKAKATRMSRGLSAIRSTG
jgi:hypothetical protein